MSWRSQPPDSDAIVFRSLHFNANATVAENILCPQAELVRGPLGQ